MMYPQIYGVVSFLGIDIPEAPTATAATSINISGFTANCNAVSGATSYRLDVSTASDFSSFVLGYENLTVAGTSQVVPGLTAGTTYYYRWRAVNTAGTSSNSNTITQITICAAPVATAATNVLTTSFTANWSSVTGASSYRLDVSTNSSFSSFVSGYENKTVSGTSSAVSGLTAGTTYYYRLRAVNTAGTSNNSNAITQITICAAPTASAATEVDITSFTANWGAVTGAATYKLDVSTSSGFGSFVAGYENLTVSGTSRSVTGLSASTTYYYRVRAVNTAGTSANSNTITQATNIAIPDAPVATAATSVATTSFQANWNAVTGASTYRLDVTYKVGGEEFFVAGYENLSVSTTYRSVTGLTAGVEYTYRVRAVNTSGTSGNSNAIEIYTVTNAPVATAASSLGQTSFIANWNTVTSAASYRLDVSTVSDFSSFVSGYQSANVSPGATVSGLTAGTTYYYRVRAVNPDGYASANSNTITQITIPAAPVATAASLVGETSFRANWNSVTGAASYRLDVSTSSGFGSFVLGYENKIVSALYDSVTGLSGSTTYYYRVRAVNTAGISGNSNTITQATTTVPPATPTGLSVIEAGVKSWSASWNSVSGATGYAIRSRTNGGSWSFAEAVAGTSYSSLIRYDPCDYVEVQVRATNAAGDSAWSSAVDVYIDCF